MFWGVSEHSDDECRRYQEAAIRESTYSEIVVNASSHVAII